MDELLALYGDPYQINKYITITPPTLRQIKEHGEREYFSLVNLMTTIPSNMKSILHDSGIDYEKISDFQLFEMLIRGLPKEESSILFGDVDFQSLGAFLNNETGLTFLAKSTLFLDEVICANGEDLANLVGSLFKDDSFDKVIELVSLRKSDQISQEQFEACFPQDIRKLIIPKMNDLIIDTYAHVKIDKYLRDLHGFAPRETCVEIAGNALTKKFLINDDREERERNKNKPFKSMLAPYINAMANCADFPYDHFTMLDLHISTFMKSVKQVLKLKNVGYLMQGVYSGTIDAKKVKNQLNWIN